MQELIHTKVAPPGWMGNQIDRDVLLGHLDRALGCRLTLVHAPAGYGKTSLLAQWLGRCGQRDLLTAWLTIDRDDVDPVRLAQYLLLSLDSRPTGDDGDHKFVDLPPRAALSAVIARMAVEPRPVLVFLDDLHLADSAPARDFVRGLIRLAPENAHFVVATRDYPWLGQSVLAAEGQLLELGVKDLKFSASESDLLLRRGPGRNLASEHLQRIVERTEGWPIAIQLAALTINAAAPDMNSLADRLDQPSPELGRYLAEQVLMNLPEEAQQLLIQTALLDRLTGEGVNLVCDRTDGWLLIERLEQQGVMLTPETADRKAYRYHQLFAQYLRERFERQDVSGFRNCHRRLARWMADLGNVPSAVDHAVLGADHDSVAEIIERFGGWRLIPQGLQPSVERGLSNLPEARIEGRPLLALAKVYLDIKLGRMGSARSCYDQVVAECSGLDTSASLWTEIRVVGDVLAEYENQPMSFEDLLNREALLRTLPSNDHLVLATFSESLGAKYYEGGWLERSLEPTMAAREHYQALGLVYSDLFTRFHEARIKRAQGRIKDATTILAATRETIHANFGERSDLAANCAAFEAELLYECGQTDAAECLLAWALPHMEQFDGWVDVYAAAFFTQARIFAGRGLLDEARAILGRARRLAVRRRFRQLELLAGLCELELLIHFEPSLNEAQDLARTIGLDELADEMALDSPVYRPVAVAAALARVRLGLLEGPADAAMSELQALRRWASQHGAGRLLLDIDILAAFGFRSTDAGELSRGCFEQAIGLAVFQDLSQPFIDAARFVKPLLDDMPAEAASPDRFRTQFVRSIARATAGRRCEEQAVPFLNDAEATILEHLSFGYSNKEIARLIGMSPDTVKYRLKAVFRKLGVNKRRDAVRISRERATRTDA